MTSILSEEWRVRFLKKMKEQPFFSENFEKCALDFVKNSSWMHNDTMQKALGISTFECEHMYLEAYNLYASNDLEKSEELFRCLVCLDPFIDKYWFGLSACLQLMNRYEEALKGYAVMATLEETSPYPHYYASECLLQLNRISESKEALQYARQLASASPKYQKLNQAMKKEL